MSDKQFPPAQALRAVPLAEAEIMRKWMGECRKLWLNGSPLLRLVEFVEQFRRTQLPKMQLAIAGSINEILITDSDVDADQINLVRLNGRVFSPEIIEVDGGEALSPLDAWIDLINKDDRTSPEEYPNHALIRSDELAYYMNSAAPINFLDEDNLTEIIDETLGPDWTARQAARAIHAELYGEGE